MNDPQIAQWKPFVAIAAVTASLDQTVNAVQHASFAMAWLALETGGNPCDVGSATATPKPATSTITPALSTPTTFPRICRIMAS